MAGFCENNYKYLSDLAVKAKWTKNSHCHFCRRICDSQDELKYHLVQFIEIDNFEASGNNVNVRVLKNFCAVFNELIKVSAKLVKKNS